MPNASLLISAVMWEEQPSGLKNNVNLIFNTTYQFLPNSLEVFLGGSKLIPGLTFDFIELPNLQSFEIKIHNESSKLKSAPEYDEDLVVKYLRR